MKSTSLSLSALLLAASFALPAGAALSGNIFVNGDFESTANIRNATTPDGVLPHRFSQTYDVGNWISFWGPPSNPGGLGGMSLYNDPRNLAETGGDTMPTGNLGNFNRSVDPLDSNNHILEAVMFRGSSAQWIAGPVDQVPGPFEFSFDFMMQDNFSYDSWGRIYLFGMNVLPPNDVTFFRSPTPGAPAAMSPLDPNENPADGELLFFTTYGKWIDGSTNGIDPPYDYFDHWVHYSTAEYLENGLGEPIEPDGTPDYQWWGGHEVKTSLTQTYPYYVVVVAPVVYDESDPYFWLYGGKITDGFTFGYDNIDLKVSLAGGPDYSQYYCDFNLDGFVNVQDINPFVKALTNQAGYTTDLLGYMAANSIPAGDFDLVLMAIDPTQDGYVTPWPINVQDINPFVAALTGAGVDAASLAVIPEPASLSLLALGALALIRRR